MKIAIANISPFVISCLLHALVLWGLDSGTVMTEEQKIAPTIQVVFEDATPALSPARQSVPQKRVISTPRPKEIIKPLPRRKVLLETVSTHLLQPEDKSRPEQVEIEELAGEQNIPASIHMIGDIGPAISGQNLLEGYLAEGSALNYGGAGRVSGQNIFAGYLAIIRAMLERNKEYPLWARKNNWEGTVRLHFVVSRDGTIEDINVIGSSGFSILDKAAERTVRRIGKFPSIPKELTMGRLSLDVPLVFKLVNR
jgi:protein TonB